MDTSHLISMLVAPVVMISACGLLCLAFYNRLATIISRLRLFHSEQLLLREKLEGGKESPDNTRNRMNIVFQQINEVMARARLIRNTLVCLVLCIICMIVCSLTLGLSLVAEFMTKVSLGVFIAGQISMLIAMVFALIELKRALTPVALEKDFVESRVERMLPSETDSV